MLLFVTNYKNYQIKKIVLLFVSVLTLSLVSTSCSKDDDAEVQGPSIVGKWEISKEGFVVNGNEVLINYTNDCATSKDNVEYKADGTLVETWYYTSSCLSETASSTYTTNGATLTITDSDGPYSYVVKELSATTLKTYDTYTDAGTQITEVTLYTRVN